MRATVHLMVFAIRVDLLSVRRGVSVGGFVLGDDGAAGEELQGAWQTLRRTDGFSDCDDGQAPCV